MTTESSFPVFGPEDERGFRSFSLSTGTQESIRVSVNFRALQEYLIKTAGDLNQYSETELKSLRLAAALVAARMPRELIAKEPGDNSQAALADKVFIRLLEIAAEFAPRAFETRFPALAKEAIQAASDACVKGSLNKATSTFKAPPVTTEASVDDILANFRRMVKRYLNKPGRPLETEQLIQDVKEALRRWAKKNPNKKPTQEKIAEYMGIEPRTLRKRQEDIDITWEQLLRLCEWGDRRGAEPNPPPD